MKEKHELLGAGLRKVLKRKQNYQLRGPQKHFATGLWHLGLWGLLLGSLLTVASISIAGPSSLRITIGTFYPYYSPEFVRIAPGTSISWNNPTSGLHSITHDGCKNDAPCAFDSGPIGPNGTFTVQDLVPGNYPYHCTFHPIMRGNLIITDSSYSSET